MRSPRLPSPYPMPSRSVIGSRGRSIAEAVSARYGISLVQVQGKARARALAWPRQHVMSALREAGYSEAAIGALLNRDASTVSQGDRRHRERAAWAEVMTLAAGALDQPDLFARAA